LFASPIGVAPSPLHRDHPWLRVFMTRCPFGLNRLGFHPLMLWCGGLWGGAPPLFSARVSPLSFLPLQADKRLPSFRPINVSRADLAARSSTPTRFKAGIRDTSAGVPIISGLITSSRESRRASEYISLSFSAEPRSGEACQGRLILFQPRLWTPHARYRTADGDALAVLD